MYSFLRKYKDLENHKLNGQLTCLERLEERSLLVKFYDDVEKFENYSLINFCPIKQQSFNYKKFNTEKIFEKKFTNSELNFNTLFLTQFVPFRYINSDMDFGENLLQTFFRVKRLNFIAKCYRKRFLRMTEEIRIEGSLRFFKKLPPYFYNWHIKRIFYLYFHKNIFIKNCIKKFYINFFDAIFFQVAIKSFQKSLCIKKEKFFFLENMYKEVYNKIVFFLNETFLKKSFVKKIIIKKGTLKIKIFWKKDSPKKGLFLSKIATNISRKYLLRQKSVIFKEKKKFQIQNYFKKILKLQILSYLWKTKKSLKIFKMLVFRQKIFFLKKSFIRNKFLKKKSKMKQFLKKKNTQYFIIRKIKPSRRRIQEIAELRRLGILPPRSESLKLFPTPIRRKRRLTKKQKYWLKRKKNKTPWIKEFEDFPNRRCCFLLNSNKFFIKNLFVKKRIVKRRRKFKAVNNLKEMGPCYIMIPSKLPREVPSIKNSFSKKHIFIKYVKIKNQIKI